MKTQHARGHIPSDHSRFHIFHPSFLGILPGMAQPGELWANAEHLSLSQIRVEEAEDRREMGRMQK